MGRIGKLLSFVRTLRNGSKVSDAKVDLGGGENILSEHFSDAGDDSFPLDTDYVLASQIPRAGGHVVAGYLDPINEPIAMPGDKRIFARDPATGIAIVEVWLKGDGAALVSNANCSFTLDPAGSIKGINGNGSFELEIGGDCVINGVVIDTSGNITSPAKIDAQEVDAATSLIAAGKEIVAHTHPITGGSSAPGPTGPNN